MRKVNLLLHCGADAISREAVYNVETPNRTKTWNPIPHTHLLNQVEELLPSFGLRVINEAHALSHEDSRYFGLLQVANGNNSDEYSWVIGLRNSHDKACAAGIVAGTQVLVCDNLSFDGEIKVGRKHTCYVERDLPALTKSALNELSSRWKKQDQRLETYKENRLSSITAHDLVIHAMDRNIIPASKIPDVLGEYRKPRFVAFSEPNCWSLFNAFTERLKGYSLSQLSDRTTKLHCLMDEYVGLN